MVARHLSAHDDIMKPDRLGHRIDAELISKAMTKLSVRCERSRAVTDAIAQQHEIADGVFSPRIVHQQFLDVA